MKHLPIGIQTFSDIITDNYLYIDKTKYIYDLINSGKVFFLSRPRRFGKSLLVSALKSIFLGEKEYFNGLYIYDKIEWVKHPVIHIDFSKIAHRNAEMMEKSLSLFIDEIANDFNIELKKDFHSDKFAELIKKNSKKVMIKKL